MKTGILEDKIQESGLRIGFIAEKMGISLQALNKKRNGEIEFSLKDVRVLKELLGLSVSEVNKIFLEETATK